MRMLPMRFPIQIVLRAGSQPRWQWPPASAVLDEVSLYLPECLSEAWEPLSVGKRRHQYYRHRY